MDFPGVVRSVLCLPILLHNAPVGFLILSHSLPKLLPRQPHPCLENTGQPDRALEAPSPGRQAFCLLQSRRRKLNQEIPEKPDAYSVVLMEFDTQDAYGRHVPLQQGSRTRNTLLLQSVLEGKESVLFYGEKRAPGVYARRIFGNAARPHTRNCERHSIAGRRIAWRISGTLASIWDFRPAKGKKIFPEPSKLLLL